MICRATLSDPADSPKIDTVSGSTPITGNAFPHPGLGKTLIPQASIVRDQLCAQGEPVVESDNDDLPLQAELRTLYMFDPNSRDTPRIQTMIGAVWPVQY